MDSVKIIREAPIFVRVDDLGSDDLPHIQSIVDITKDNSLPVILGVIPGLLSSQTVDYLRSELRQNWPYLIIAQHGVNHVAHPKFERKMEFSLREPVEEVAAKLLTGKRIMQSKIDIPVNWYIPPWNKYGRNLIHALENTGYQAFSASTKIPFPKSLLANFPINQDVIVDLEAGRIEPDPQVWLEETKKNLASQGKNGLMLHHHLMEKKDIETFKEWAMNCRKYTA